MDITAALAPRSDQQNADDYVTGPKTVSISDVTEGSTEQPVVVHLTEYPGRPFKPSKTALRVLAAAWGEETAAWHGRRLTLYADPTVKWGGVAVGGIRISHMSNIDKPLKLALTVTKGKRAPVTVQPLPDAPAATKEAWQVQWEAITQALTAAGYTGDGPAMLATAAQVIGGTWEHPNKISAEDAQKILAAVREDEGANE